MRMFVRGTVLLLVWYSQGGFHDLRAQISLTPKRVVIQASSKTGELRVSNGSGVVQEITLVAEFEYPVFDRNGDMRFQNSAETSLDVSSLDSVISIFPRQFLLEPGSTQVVRLFIDRRFEPPDGLYWTRIRVESFKHNTEPKADIITEGVGPRVTFQVHQSLPVYYQHGDMQTNLKLMEQSLDTVDDKDVLRSRFQRAGNGPFMGNVTTSISDEMGEIQSNITQTFYCFSEDWLVMELPERLHHSDVWEIRYHFIPRVFDRKSGEMKDGIPFEIHGILHSY